jgi:hypothetical protein
MVEALEIYRSHLTEEMGEDAPMSVDAILDPSGANEQTIYGLFDENVVNQNKDSGNVYQKVSKPRLFLSELPLDKDLMSGMDVYISYVDKTYNINYIQSDIEGVQILWLVSL